MAKVLFQSTNLRTFRGALIGYLYEIAKVHQVVLLADGMDEYTEKLLGDRSLFPGLEKTISFESPFGSDILKKNSKLHYMFKKVTQEYKPDIVVAPSDLWPAEMCLMRFAKEVHTTTLALQSGFKIAEKEKLLAWSYLMNAWKRMPEFLPFSVRMLAAKIKKYIAHFFYYWLLPLSVGEKPFFGSSSFIFWDESSGKRDADYVAVFSKRDYDIYRKDGVAAAKLFVVGHPLEHESTKRFFKNTYFSQDQQQHSSKTITLMWPEEKIGFRDKDHSVIPEEQLQKERTRVVELISQKLPDWSIFIKPHPTESKVPQIKEFLGRLSKNISVAHPAEPADKYIEMSSVICGMSLPSTAIFSASKQHPERMILSLNLSKEFLADSYKDFPGIEYIDTEERLVHTLDAIQGGTYEKKNPPVSSFDFRDAGELVSHLYAKRIS